jgi:hypothetical protein
MPRAIPLPIRHQIVDRHRAGESLPAIAADLGLSPWTVRTRWRRARDQGAAGLAPAYARCGHAGLRSSARIARAACWLRRRHPGWGARLILTILHARSPDEPLPHPRTVERWFRARELLAPPAPRRSPPPPRSPTPHAVWQLDAKEQIRLADASWASWLVASDEASGAIVATAVFPPARVDAR